VTVSGLLDRLPWRERRILAMRFYGNQTQAEIAARFGISQMHVSRLLSRALAWLRQAMLADTPAPWHGSAAESDAERRRLSVRRTGDRVAIEVSGDIDRDTGERLRWVIGEAVADASAEVVVDLSGADTVDAAGVAALIAARAAARRAGVPLRLVRATGSVRQSLAMAGLLPPVRRAA
jgi:RNA polymerase sigma-B factor